MSGSVLIHGLFGSGFSIAIGLETSLLVDIILVFNRDFSRGCCRC